MQLWRRCARDIWRSSLPLSAKLELLVLYFGVRKFATHWVSLGFFCTLVPLSIFTPEVATIPFSPLLAPCNCAALRTRLWRHACMIWTCKTGDIRHVPGKGMHS